MYYLVLALAVVFTFANCSTDEIAPQNEEGKSKVEDNSFVERQGNPVIHHVSAGSNDFCQPFDPPGCDGNFSLTANMRADGTVTGQFQDTYAGGGLGIHVNIDCMIIDGNTAIVGGIATHGYSNFFGDEDLAGKYVVTKVVDNGTSNNDPLDQISYSWFWLDINGCQDQDISSVPFNFGYTTLYEALDGELYDITKGQVTIR